MATIKQIADLTNVSRGTIDRVINNRGKVKPETEEKVRAAIEALNYLPNKAGKNLAARKKNLRFGFILISPNNYNPFFSDVEKGIQKKAKELETFGVSVDIRYTSPTEPAAQIEAMDYFAQNGYNGIAVTAINSPGIADKIREVSKSGIPVVTSNTDIPDSGRLAYTGSNYYQCGKVASNLLGLITNGRANVGIITGSENIMCITQRSAGFQDDLQEHYPNIHYAGSAVNNHYDEVENYLITKALLDEHPEIDALYLAAAGVSGACRAVTDSGRRITVIANDCAAATKELMRQGVIAATIDQNPVYQGAKPLEILFDAATTGSASIREYYYTDAIIKVRTNL